MVSELRAERREKRKSKRRHVPQGGTLGGLRAKLATNRDFLKKKRSVV